MKGFIVRIGLGIVMGGLLWGGLVASPATAASVVFSFTGTINSVDAQVNPPFGVNSSPSAMSGTMTVNTTDLDTTVPARFGEYTITAFNLNVAQTSGTYTAGLGTNNQVEIRNAVSLLTGQDQFNVTVSSPTGPNVGARFPSVFDIQLHGPNTVLGSDALPTTLNPPTIGDWSNQNLWRLVFEPGSKVVSGTLTSLTVVPLPASVILFGAGLIALVGLGAGSWRKRNNSLA